MKDRLSGGRMTPETELDRLFREYAEQLKRTPTTDAPEPMEDDDA